MSTGPLVDCVSFFKLVNPMCNDFIKMVSINLIFVDKYKKSWFSNRKWKLEIQNCLALRKFVLLMLLCCFCLLLCIFVVFY